MSTGQVKWFNNAKGFGFILPDDSNNDLFAHYSSIGMQGYKTLKAGQMVSFDIVEGPKGLHAENILTLDEAEKEESVGSEEPNKETIDEASNTENDSDSEEANKESDKDT